PRGVRATVAPLVAFLPPGVDLRCDDRAVGDQLIELGPETVVPLLGQPDGRLAICGHGRSPPSTACFLRVLPHGLFGGQTTKLPAERRYRSGQHRCTSPVTGRSVVVRVCVTRGWRCPGGGSTRTSSRPTSTP